MATMVHSKLFMDSPRSEAVDLGGGIYRTLLGYDDKILMAKVWFDKDAIGAIHSHPHSQVTYIISGKFEVEIDGLKQVLEAGGSCFIPSAKLHGSVCLEAGALLDVFSPAREDFLNAETL